MLDQSALRRPQGEAELLLHPFHLNVFAGIILNTCPAETCLISNKVGLNVEFTAFLTLPVPCFTSNAKQL